MDNPFELILKELQQMKQQQQEMNACLQRLNAKEGEDKYLSVDETRQQWRPAVSRQTIYAWAQKGLLKRHEINAKPYFLKSEVMLACRTIQRYKSKACE